MNVVKRILNRILWLSPSRFKIWYYRAVKGYTIGNNCKIGRSSINCNSVILGDQVTIYSGNVLEVQELRLGDNSSILSGNRIVGQGNFTMGAHSRIIYDHYIDVWSNVSLGDNTWLAGKGSQIWTHGSIHTKSGKVLDVHIRDNVYLGSSVKIAPGVTIASNNLVGLGSVVVQSKLKEQTIISGNPAQVVKEDIDWRENW